MTNESEYARIKAMVDDLLIRHAIPSSEREFRHTYEMKPTGKPREFERVPNFAMTAYVNKSR